MLNQKQDLRAELLVAIAPEVTRHVLENNQFAQAEKMIATKTISIAEEIAEVEMLKRVDEDAKHDK
jgi:hypothetical protein